MSSNFSAATLLSLVVGVLLIVPFTTGYIDYAYMHGTSQIQPKYYLLALTTLAFAVSLYSRPRLILPILLLGGLIAFRVVYAVVFGEPSIDLQEAIYNCGSAFVYCVALWLICGDYTRLWRTAFAAAVITLLVNVTLNVLEWNGIGTYTNANGRSAGWLENPNGSACSIVCMLAIVLSLNPRLWFAFVAICFSAVGVYFTLSRGGAAIWLGIVVVYIVSRLRFNAWKIILMFLCLIIIGAIGIRTVQSEARFTEGDLAARQALLTGSEIPLIEEDDRLALLEVSLDAILRRPLFGYGPGASLMIYTPHNEVLAVWLDNGIPGLVFFIITVAAFVRLVVRAPSASWVLAIPLLGFIPFSHNMLEDKLIICLWVLGAALSWHSRREAFSQTKAMGHVSANSV